MKNVILVGKMNDVLQDIYSSLISEFSVQLCANDEDSFVGISKIFRPDLVVLGCFGLEGVKHRIFDILSESFPHLPVLVIANESDGPKYAEYCSKMQYELLLRPTTNVKLLNCCFKLVKSQKDTEEVDYGAHIKKKILVVDDSPLVLRNLKEVLKDDYTVFFASSGEQALKFIPMKMPDLVLLDYEMPGMNGKETFEAIRKDDFNRTLPVIFLTSMSKKEQIVEILQLGPTDYILKPPSKEDLLNRIETALNKK